MAGWQTNTGLVILVVAADDAAGSADIGLAGHGFSVRRAGTASEALRSAAAGPPDVVLMDFAAPGVDGPALARSRRDQTKGEQPLLVALTGCGPAAALREPAVVDLYVAWPVGSALLIDVLNRFHVFLADRRQTRNTPNILIVEPFAHFRPRIE